MKIYTRCVYAWRPDGSPVLEESDSFEYEGPVILTKDSPSAPAAPDYVGAAREQGVANVDTARVQGRIGNPNVINPYGTQNITWGNDPATGRPGGGFDQAGYDAAMSAWNAGGAGNGQPQYINNNSNADGAPSQILNPNYVAGVAGGTGTAPTREQFTTANPFADQATITQTLNPTSQRTFNQQQAVQLGLAQLANQGVGNVRNVLGTGFNYQGPDIQTSLGNPGRLQTQVANAGQIQGGPQADSYGLAQGGVDAPNLQMQLDRSGVAQMPVNAGMTAQNAIMSRLQPQIERERSQMETQLRNQGLVAGGEAYGNAATIQNQRENDLLSQAALQGVNLDMSANQQGFNQAVQSGQFGNEAQMASFGAGLQNQQAQNQAIGQNFGQAVTAAQLQNAQQNQLYGQNLSNANFANATVGQQYNQNLGAAQFRNTAQQQGYGQQLTERNLPLNEISALMSGSQIQNPQFQAYQGAQVAPTPVMQGAQAQGQYNQGLYNSQVGQANSFNSGLMQLGGALGSAFLFSDRRLKSNIERIGTHPLGIGVYEYDIFGEREMGVMADEVFHVKPEAVLTHPSGFLMVNYGSL